MHSLGIAFSGGGVRGASHIGVIKALDSWNMIPDMVSGTSAGALIAGLLASGLRGKEIEEIALEMSKIGNKWLDFETFGAIRGVLDLAFSREMKLQGLVKGNKLYKYFLKITGGKKLSESCMPVSITATDINTGKLVVFSNCLVNCDLFGRAVHIGDALIADAMRASMSIPGIFKPFMFQGMRLVDGGVLDNIPVGLLRHIGAEKTIGINAGYDGKPRPDVDNIFEVIGQTINLLMFCSAKKQINMADCMIDISGMENISLLDFHKIKEAIKTGEQIAMRNKYRILETA